MGYPSGVVGLPIPFGFEGNNVPGDILAFGQRLDDIFNAHTYAEIDALGGADVWDGRIMYQTDTGALRPWIGLYVYKGSTAAWQALVPTGPPIAYTPVLSGFNNSVPTYGTGGYQIGRWSRFGSFVLCGFIFYMGTTGFVAGVTSKLLFSLPVPAKETVDAVPIGKVWLYDASAPRHYIGDLATPNLSGFANSSATAVALYRGLATTAYMLANAPITTGFQQSDKVMGVAFYEAVEA